MKLAVIRVWAGVGLVYAAVAAVAATGSSAGGNAAPAPDDLWDGVYTKKQAERGGTVYSDYCLRCHGEDLETARGGTEYGIPSPPLAGSRFRDAWKGKNLDELFALIQMTMPKNVSVKLTPEECAEVVAFLLEQNGFPAGDSELPANPALLKSIRFAAAAPTR